MKDRFLKFAVALTLTLPMHWGWHLQAQTQSPFPLSRPTQSGKLIVSTNGAAVSFDSGQAAIPADLPHRVVQIAARYASDNEKYQNDTAIALIDDGSVRVWGDDSHGECQVPEAVKNIVRVGQGKNFCAALDAAGRLFVWGLDGIQPPEQVRPIVNFACGLSHIVAIQNDGTVASWGGSSASQRGKPADLRNIVQVDALHDSSLALDSDGKVHVWGVDKVGAANIPSDLPVLSEAHFIGAAVFARSQDGSWHSWSDWQYRDYQLNFLRNHSAKKPAAMFFGPRGAAVIDNAGQLTASGSYKTEHLRKNLGKVLSLELSAFHTFFIVDSPDSSPANDTLTKVDPAPTSAAEKKEPIPAGNMQVESETAERSRMEQTKVPRKGFRVFTAASGNSEVIAKPLSLVDGKVTLEKQADGSALKIPLVQLSEADQQYLTSRFEGADNSTMATITPPPAVENAEKIAAINEAIGHELFADNSLWDDDPSTVSERVNWPRESKTEFQSSYRLYPREDYRLLGTRPFSVCLFGEGGQTTSVSVVFSNKGDRIPMRLPENPRTKDENEQILEHLRSSMKSDLDAIVEKLTPLLGECSEEYYGERETRTRVLRWNWKQHALLLSYQDDEYLSLLIQPAEIADKRGRVDRITAGVIRNRCRSNVENRENGDVVVKNIPMVNQGPKGYCVPASFERSMRYMGVPADMYVLAMIGNTRLGGGTGGGLLGTYAESAAKRKGRSMERHRGIMEMDTIAGYIDKGIPLMWGMFHSKALSITANRRTAERKKAIDMKAWRDTIAQTAENSTWSTETGVGHMNLIVGYNEQTGEIAFSDHGNEAKVGERWITLVEANKISQRFIAAITY